MFLTRLVYASTIEQGFDLSTVEKIISSARKHNTALDVTGRNTASQSHQVRCY